MTTSDRDTPPLRIRLGQVGGGQDAFIGAVHRIAGRLDDRRRSRMRERSPRSSRMADKIEERVGQSGHKQATWRADPERWGAGGSIGDIGTHAYHLVTYLIGLSATEVLADLGSFIEGRMLDDNAHVLMGLPGGIKGMLWSSQIAIGNENALPVRIYGSKGALEWEQENPNHLWYAPRGGPRQRLSRSGAGSGSAAASSSRIPPGHCRRTANGGQTGGPDSVRDRGRARHRSKHRRGVRA